MSGEPTTARRDFTQKRHSTSYNTVSPLKLDLSGRYVLVTGTAFETGVGYATATAFARAGVSGIALFDLHGVSDDLVSKLRHVAVNAGHSKPSIISCTVDISDAAAVRAAHAKVSEAFNGRLDVLVNNAAHMEPYERFLDADPDVLAYMAGQSRRPLQYGPRLSSTPAIHSGRQWRWALYDGQCIFVGRSECTPGEHGISVIETCRYTLD